eukprot:gene28101-31209_t
MDATWDIDKALDTYIYDYLKKKEYNQTAATFKAEARVPDRPVGVDYPRGFLFEWWMVFWEIFSTRLSQTFSEAASNYLEVQKAKHDQQMLQMKLHQTIQQRRMGGASEGPSPSNWNQMGPADVAMLGGDPTNQQQMIQMQQQQQQSQQQQQPIDCVPTMPGSGIMDQANSNMARQMGMPPGSAGTQGLLGQAIPRDQMTMQQRLLMASSGGGAGGGGAASSGGGGPTKSASNSGKTGAQNPNMPGGMTSNMAAGMTSNPMSGGGQGQASNGNMDTSMVTPEQQQAYMQQKQENQMQMQQQMMQMQQQAGNDMNAQVAGSPGNLLTLSRTFACSLARRWLDRLATFSHFLTHLPAHSPVAGSPGNWPMAANQGGGSMGPPQPNMSVAGNSGSGVRAAGKGMSSSLEAMSAGEGDKGGKGGGKNAGKSKKSGRKRKEPAADAGGGAEGGAAADGGDTAKADSEPAHSGGAEVEPGQGSFNWMSSSMVQPGGSMQMAQQGSKPAGAAEGSNQGANGGQGASRQQQQKSQSKAGSLLGNDGSMDSASDVESENQGAGGGQRASEQQQHKSESKAGSLLGNDGSMDSASDVKSENQGAGGGQGASERQQQKSECKAGSLLGIDGSMDSASDVESENQGAGGGHGASKRQQHKSESKAGSLLGIDGSMDFDRNMTSFLENNVDAAMADAILGGGMFPGLTPREGIPK